jgi:hypothetical protein
VQDPYVQRLVISWWRVVKRFDRWMFTKCSWCGMHSTLSDPVEYSVKAWDGWAPYHTSKLGEKNLLHRGCVLVAGAARLCLCTDAVLDGLGRCRICMKWAARGRRPNEAEWYLAMLPKGSRASPAVRVEIQKLRGYGG